VDKILSVLSKTRDLREKRKKLRQEANALNKSISQNERNLDYLIGELS